jgi:hypothetical protein
MKTYGKWSSNFNDFQWFQFRLFLISEKLSSVPNKEQIEGMFQNACLWNGVPIGCLSRLFVQKWIFGMNASSRRCNCRRFGLLLLQTETEFL